MRRNVGVGKVRNSQRTRERYDRTGKDLAETKKEHVEASLVDFRARLTEFAQQNVKLINKDPEFRKEFHTMCALVGVDVLATSKNSSVFGNLFGGLNDFYVQLGVKILNLSLETRATDGGLMPFTRVLRSVNAKSTIASADDVRRAVTSLESLGSGLCCVVVDDVDYVSTLDPLESRDELEALAAADPSTGRIDVHKLRNEIGVDRASKALTELSSRSVAWIDSGGGENVDAYYVYSVYSEGLK